MLTLAVVTMLTQDGVLRLWVCCFIHLPKSKDPFRRRTPSCALFVTQLPGSKNPLGTGVNANSSTSKNADTGRSPAPVDNQYVFLLKKILTEAVVREC